jgi:hypothetical protein
VVELPEPAEPPDPVGGSSKMTISSLSRTERAADFQGIFKINWDLNQPELDSHADMCVAGANMVVMEFTDTKVNMSLFIDTYKAIAASQL